MDRFRSFRDHRIILLLFCTAVLIRYAIFLSFSPLTGGGHDYEMYHAVAQNLLATGSFGDNPFLAPGWPILLSSVYAFSSGGQLFLGLLQSIFGALLVVGIYLLGSHVFNSRTGLFAGILALFWPPFLLITIEYGSHTIFFSVLSLFGILFFFRGMREGRIGMASVSGILLAWAALIRAIGLYVPVMLAVWLAAVLIFRLNQFTVRQVLPSLIVFTIAFVLPVSLWAHRNAVVFQHLSPQTPITEVPFVNKRIEKEAFTPYFARLLILPFLPSHLNEGIEGMQKLLLIPYNLSTLDAASPRSYVVMARELTSGNFPAASPQEWLIFMVKGMATALHNVVVIAGILGILFLSAETIGGLVGLVLVYTAGASISVGSLTADHFKSISPLSSFLVPLMPFLIVFASALFIRLRGKSLATLL